MIAHERSRLHAISRAFAAEIRAASVCGLQLPFSCGKNPKWHALTKCPCHAASILRRGGCIWRGRLSLPVAALCTHYLLADEV